jgi:hypothetical protein
VAASVRVRNARLTSSSAIYHQELAGLLSHGAHTEPIV